MNEKIFSWKQLLLVSIIVGIASSALALEFAPSAKGKYALIDKEAVVADYIFSKPHFNDGDRKRILEAIDSVQEKYSRQGYLVIERTVCKPGDVCTVLSAAPTETINITDDLRQSLLQP